MQYIYSYVICIFHTHMYVHICILIYSVCSMFIQYVCMCVCVFFHDWLLWFNFVFVRKSQIVQIVACNSQFLLYLYCCTIYHKHVLICLTYGMYVEMQLLSHKVCEKHHLSKMVVPAFILYGKLTSTSLPTLEIPINLPILRCSNANVCSGFTVY
jgi:hypothetical protein